MNILNKSFLFLTLLIPSCSALKENPLEYNETLTKIVAEVDSLRLEIGDRPDELQEETARDLKAFKTGIKKNLAVLDTLRGFEKDTLFKNKVNNYLLVNQKILKEDILVIAQIQDKILSNNATEEDRQWAIKINERIDDKIERATFEVQKAQADFARRNKYSTKDKE